MEKPYVLSCFLFIFLISTGHSTGSIFQPLSDYVKSQLQPYIVPQVDASQPVTVNVQTGVYAIDDVDRRLNELHIRSWLHLAWNSTITWDPRDFNGLTTLRLPSADGYVPQVASLSSAGFHEILSPLETRYLFNGVAAFFATVKWRLLCDVSASDACAIKMYSSDYDNNSVRLRLPDPDSRSPAYLSKMKERLRLEKSEYEIVSESYSEGNETVRGIRGAHDWVQYSFSFKKRRAGVFNGPMAIFKWY